MTGDLRRGSDPTPHPTPCLDDAAYVLGSLSPADRQAFEQHLAGCSKCQTAISRLAGLPGLLATTSPTDLAVTSTPVPDTLLPRLLTTVTRERRRRVALAGLAGAAAAAVIALVVALIIRPSTAAPEALPAPVQMQALVAVPLDVSVQLTDKQWGTSVVVHCAYDGPHQAGIGYQLVAFDPTGKPQTLGWWGSVNGSASTVTTASSLRLKDISRLEVQLDDGRALLRAVPPTG